MDRATGATIVLTVACGHRGESTLRYYYSVNDELARLVDGKSDPHSVSVLLDRLSSALQAAGIDLTGSIRKGALPLVSSASAKTRGVRALPKWRLLRVLDYIDANVSKAITLPDLSAAAGMSRMYFARQFRAATGHRPHDFVLRKRIEHAQRLLMNTSQALVEVALNAGFQTQAHFTTVFRKIVGDTPHRWRREQAFRRSASERSAFTTLAI